MVSCSTNKCQVVVVSVASFYQLLATLDQLLPADWLLVLLSATTSGHPRLPVLTSFMCYSLQTNYSCFPAYIYSWLVMHSIAAAWLERARFGGSATSERQAWQESFLWGWRVLLASVMGPLTHTHCFDMLFLGCSSACVFAFGA